MAKVNRVHIIKADSYVRCEEDTNAVIFKVEKDLLSYIKNVKTDLSVFINNDGRPRYFMRIQFTFADKYHTNEMIDKINECFKHL